MKKKNRIKVRFSTFLLCCLAILLCTAPRGWAVIYDDGVERDVTDPAGLDWLHVGADTTVNLYADISQYVYADPGSILNIYSGNVDWYIAISPDEPKAQVTVYGTGFEDKLGPVDYGQWTPDGGADTLMGQYKGGSPINLLIWSNISISLQPPPSDGQKEITIDIKPGGNPNRINLKSKGVVPVAVLTTDSFDAGNIDPTTVEFAGASPVRWKLEDVDDDGDKDMLLHFKTQELKLVESITESTEATETTLRLTGNRTDGEVIQGTDKVCIVPGKK